MADNVNAPYSVACRTLVLGLDARGRAVSLRGMDSGFEFLSAGTPPVGLWQVGLMRPAGWGDPLPPLDVPDLEYDGHEWWANRDEYRSELELSDSDAPTPRITANPHSITLEWNAATPPGSVSVTLRIEGGLEREQLAFGLSVDMPDGWALKRATFPRLRGFGCPADPAGDALLYPENWGVLRANPLEDMTCYTGQYPGSANWCQMTAWLHGQDGLYLGVLDPDTHHTGIDAQYIEDVCPAPWNIERWHIEKGHAPWLEPRRPLADRLAAGRKPAVQIRCNHWPEQVSGRWECPYPVVLQGFRGTWYEAAQIHRAWATQQRWCRRGRLAARTDDSPALAGLDLWLTRYGFPPWSNEPAPAWAFRDAMHALHDFFGMPFGVHWYHWHAFTWHSRFPSHTPVVEGFEEVLHDLQRRGIVVMPYCQGRLLYRDRAALDTERAHASIQANGQPYLEMYTPQDDWPLALCPGSAWSRERWIETARMLWEQYGTEGVYFDQITAMPPSLCYHTAHGHPPGGGRHYWAGYDQALADMAPMVATDPRRFLSSELMADAYMDRIDLYLSFVPPVEDYVPLFAAIYSGYTTVMGRATPGEVMADPQLFAICQGEQLLFGGQLGWVSDEILAHPGAAVYLRALARLRAPLRDILHTGTLEAPLEIEQDRRIRLTLSAALCAKHPVTLDRPAVRHTVWRAPDGRVLVLLLNEAEEDADVAFAPRTDWPRGSWQRRQLGDETVQTMDIGERVVLTLAPFSVVTLVSG